MIPAIPRASSYVLFDPSLPHLSPSIFAAAVGCSRDSTERDFPALACGDEPGDATPPGFMILGTGDTSQWDAAQGNERATMGMYTSVGTAFSGATTDWPRVLSQGTRRPRRSGDGSVSELFFTR